MRMIKLLSILLATAVLLTTVSCSDSEKKSRRAEITSALYAESGTEIPLEITPTVETESVTNSFGLCYSKADTLNPYNCITNLNASIASLIYDPLVRIGPDYSIEYIVGQKIIISGKTIKVDIKSNILFSDGSLLVPQDVVYSFAAAAREGSRFRSQLLPIVSCTLDGSTILFELASEDKMGAYLLNFPIIKRNSDLDSAVFPTGSGRYVYVNDATAGTFLQANRWWYSNTEPNIKKILLLKLPSIEAIVNSVEIGTLSFYYTDLRSGTPTRINSATTLVDLNNLVFMGINTNNTLLAQIEIRRAISNALDRSDIATKSYNGRANAATGPFTQKWTEAANLQTNSIFSERKLSDADLSAIGFVNIGNDSIRTNGNGTRLSFKLLVNGDNAPRLDAANLIAEQLKHAGIEIIVESVNTETYLSRVMSGSYEIYLGEYALTNNMNLTPLISTESGYYSGPAPYSTQKAFNNWRKGEGELSDLISVFNNELPFIPVCYRMGLSCYTRTLSGDIKTTEDDPFYNIQEWKMTK